MQLLHRSQGDEFWSDISHQVIALDGVSRRCNYDLSPVIAEVSASLYQVVPVVGDMLDVRVDGDSFLLLDVTSVVQDPSTGLVEVAAREILDRLRRHWCAEFTWTGPHGWWTGLLSPDIDEFYYGSNSPGHWDEQYISILFLLRAAFTRFLGIVLDTSTIDSTQSGFTFPNMSGNPAPVTYSGLYLCLHQVWQIGTTDPARRFYETASLFDLLGALQSILRLRLAYGNLGYSLVTMDARYDIHPDHVFSYSLSSQDAAPFVRLSSSIIDIPLMYGNAWTDDEVTEVAASSLTDVEIAALENTGPQAPQEIDIPANLHLFRKRLYTNSIISLQYNSDNQLLQYGGQYWPDFHTQAARLLATRYTEPVIFNAFDTLTDNYDPNLFSFEATMKAGKSLSLRVLV